MFNFLDRKMTPFELSVLESNIKANKIIDYLKEAIDEGLDPNDVDIDYYGVLEEDLLMIKTEIEEYFIKKNR